MSTETLNRTSVVTEVYPKKISKKEDLSPSKVNIDVLKKVFEEKKREISEQSDDGHVLYFTCNGVFSCLTRNIINR